MKSKYLSLIAVLVIAISSSLCFAESEGNGKGNGVDGEDLCKNSETRQQCQQQRQQNQQQQQQRQVNNTCKNFARALHWSELMAEIACTGANASFPTSPISCLYYAESLILVPLAEGTRMKTAELCQGATAPEAPIQCAELLGLSLEEAIVYCPGARNAKARLKCLGQQHEEDGSRTLEVAMEACKDR